jgi:hypothetical protein
MDQISLSKAGILNGKLHFLVFAAYIVALAVTVLNHEPWMDEAQAWLLVQDTTPGELFAKYLRYEGSPGLWHLILLVPAKLGLPYFTLNVLSAAFAASGVWLFLSRSPFPLFAKFLFPFSYFVFFQYGVVARSYCLIPLLLFWIASRYETKNEHPFRFVVPLCLLALVSVHTFLIAGGIFAVHLLDVIGEWRRSNAVDFRRHAGALALFAVNCIFVVVVLAPPGDHFLGDENNWNLIRYFWVATWALPASLVLDESSAYLNLQRVVSLVIFALSVWWLKRRNLVILYLVPLALLMALFSVKYRNFWHDGVTFLLWVFVLWVGFQRRPASSNGNRFEPAFSIVVTLVLGIHVYWGFYAVRNDIAQNYSGSAEVAEYIRKQGLENRPIFATGWKTAAVQPYFDRNPFYNYNEGSDRRFWDWSMSNQTPLGMGGAVRLRILDERPDFVLIASDHLESAEIPVPEGYRMERAFFGYLFWKTGIFELNTFWLLRRVDEQYPDSVQPQSVTE